MSSDYNKKPGTSNLRLGGRKVYFAAPFEGGRSQWWECGTAGQFVCTGRTRRVMNADTQHAFSELFIQTQSREWCCPQLRCVFQPQPHAEISSLICMDFSSTILNPVKFPFSASYPRPQHVKGSFVSVDCGTKTNK